MKKNDYICSLTSVGCMLSGSILMIGNFYPQSFLTGSILLGTGILFGITYSCISGLRYYKESEKERLINNLSSSTTF